MIVRVVKMTFINESIPPFLTFLSSYTPQIRAVPGCRFLQVLRDKDNPDLFVTLSHWDSDQDLDNYRHSELFKFVWARTKINFSKAPEAYSLTVIETLD
jgi:hypothetical protein